MGEYQHSLDEKGRLIIPAKFRDDLGSSFVITRGLDKCLFVYPAGEWSSLEEKLKNLPLTKADARSFVRFLLAGATQSDLDTQGRVMLPQNLREHANIQRDVVVIGVGTRVEIWAKEEWETYESNASSSFEEIAEKIVDLGL